MNIRKTFGILVTLALAAAVTTVVLWRPMPAPRAHLVHPEKPRTPAQPPNPSHPNPSRPIPTAAISTAAQALLPKPCFAIPAPLALILDPGQPFPQRLAQARALSNHLTGDEIHALLLYLQQPTLIHGNEIKGEIPLRNDILNILELQHKPPARLTQTLIAIYQDATQLEGWRNYAIQHMGIWHAKAPQREKQQLVKTLWQATDQIDSTLPGAALLSLTDIAKTQPPSPNPQHSPKATPHSVLAIDTRHLSSKALALATNPKANAASRIAALSACALTDTKEAMTCLQNLIHNETDPLLRATAIAKLGQMTRDKTLIQEWTRHEHPLLQKAVRVVLQSIDAKEKL